MTRIDTSAIESRWTMPGPHLGRMYGVTHEGALLRRDDPSFHQKGRWEVERAAPEGATKEQKRQRVQALCKSLRDAGYREVVS